MLKFLLRVYYNSTRATDLIILFVVVSTVFTMLRSFRAEEYSYARRLEDFYPAGTSTTVIVLEYCY